jgi:hypothetical protein
MGRVFNATPQPLYPRERRGTEAGWDPEPVWTGRNEYNISIRKSKGTGPTDQHRCRWKDNIKVNLKQCEEVWTGINLHEGRFF